ncbi:MAG: hypothetical protein EOO06_06715 [Chitinophagaceae bacterium]|nr:MAG: hypothetical protein EOO06_06715 [Chitinophagaceae bacterium]
MELLQKPWVRILVSLLIGGMAVEVLHLITAADVNDRSNDRTPGLFWPVTIIAYLILSYIAKSGRVR